MKNLNSVQINAAIKKNQRYLIFGIIALILAALLIYLGIRNSEKDLPDPINLNDLITEGSDTENIPVYVDVNMQPYLFAVYTTDGVEEDNKFYFVVDSNDYLYILYMSTSNYNKLNIDSIVEKPIRVYGITKKIDDDIKELAIETYNEEMQEEYLNNENFQDYVGLIYLDMETNLNDSSMYYIAAFVLFIVFLVLIILYLINFFKNKKIFKNFSHEELEKIGAEIYELREKPYSKMKFYLLKDYVVDLSNSIIILKYQDILWAYPYEYRYNGMLVNKNIKVVDKNNKYYDIANTKYLDKEKDKVLQDILEKLKEKNPEIILGFNKENQKKVKEKLKNKN